MRTGGGVVSLHVLLVVVSGGSLGCGFNCTCVTDGGRRGAVTEPYGSTFKIITLTLESSGGACYKAKALELTSMSSQSVGLEWGSGVSIAHGLGPKL